MNLKIDVPTDDDLVHVARLMRERDAEELAAVYPVDDRTEVADTFVARYRGRPELICAAGSSGSPIAIGLPIETRPNVVTLVFVATADFREIAVPLGRWIRTKLFRSFKSAGCHRIETTTIDGYEETHRWLEMLGLRHEAAHPGYGKRGETFHTYAWVRDDVRSPGA